MLTLYRRHKRACPHAERFLKKDSHRCPVWVEGIVNGVYHRHSLKVSSWEQAEQIRRQMEEGRPAAEPSIDSSLDAFLAEQKSRALSLATQRKLKVLATSLRSFCVERGLTRLHQLDLERTREFRNSWKDSAISALKKLERLRSFFSFCVASGWRKDNPARIIKNPIITNAPTLPFTDAEIQSILKHACGKWRVLALVLLHSGLRLGDAMQLTPQQLQDGRLFLYTQKTNVPVHIPLPELVLRELAKLPLEGGYYFWRRETASNVDTASGNARRAFRTIFIRAKIAGGHPHRFRDTFAVRLLEAGVPLQDVSILLGHSSVKVTEKHYAPWVKERQARLEELVQRTWRTQLVRVK
jgi:integrase/recombinase XerD